MKHAACNRRDTHESGEGNHVLHNITHSVPNSEADRIKITTLPGSSTTLKQSQEVLSGVDDCLCSACVKERERDTVKCKVRL